MKTIHLTLIVFAMALGAFAFHNIFSVQPKIVRINVRDLPSHGVRLISPTDPSFEDEIAKLRLDEEGSQAPPDIAKPFSVVLKNTSRRDIIGVRIRWDSIGPDGRTTTHVQSYSDMGSLIGMGPMNPRDEIPGGVRLKPQKARYISLIESTGAAQGAGIAASSRGGNSEEDAARMQQLGQEQSREQALAILATLLNRSLSVTATLDAAIFDDGTVVGPDSLDYFGELQAIVKAKRDILEDVLSGAQRNEPFANIFSRMDSIAKQDKKPSNGTIPAQSAYYELYKKEFAAELVRMRATDGNEKRVAWNATRALFRYWPKLRKG
jgi:hypothetical protein